MTALGGSCLLVVTRLHWPPVVGLGCSIGTSPGGRRVIVSRPTVTVCVINWNGSDVLPACLAAVFAQVPAVVDVVVVDDASTDGGLGLVQDCFPMVRVVRRPVNRGPAAARNAGYAVSGGELVVFVDNG